jgi:hypothetical protein
MKKSAKNCTFYHVVNKTNLYGLILVLPAQVAPIYWCYGHHSTNIMVLLVLAAPIYWCYDVRSTNILVLLVMEAPIGEDTQSFYNLKNFADFLNVCSANILVLTGLQHQYIGAVQGESKCLQHRAYSVKCCLFSQLE